MIELWIENPLIEIIFGIVSLMGVVMLGWSNLSVDPPNAAELIKGEVSV